MIYLDNAATTGVKPRSVREAVNTALREYSVNPGRGGYSRARLCDERIYACRGEISDFFGLGDPTKVIFTQNCTTATNIVLKSILKPGDHVVVSSMEHNAVMRPLNVLRQQGVIADTVTVVPEHPKETLDAFSAAITDQTRLVICIHASNVSGHILPIGEIAAIAHRHGANLFVDAAQTAGVLPVDMRESGIDYMTVAAHKGLYAPSGIGLLLAQGDLDKTFIEGGTGTHSASSEQPLDLPERFESGTLSVPLIFGLRAGLAFVSKEKPVNLYRRELSLAAYAYDGLGSMSAVRLFSERPAEGYSVPTLSFSVNQRDPFDVAAFLDDRNIAVRAGLHCAPNAHKTLGTFPTGTVRISFSAFNNREEVSRFLTVISDFIKKNRL